MSTATSQHAMPDWGSAPTAKILIAEDAAITQDLLKLLLSKRGHQVAIANDGEDALRLLQQENFDIVLMDYLMPKYNGIEVVREYRKSKTGGPSPTFVAMTADAEALQSGAGDGSEFWTLLRKPFEFPRLFEIIDEALSSRQLGTHAPSVSTIIDLDGSSAKAIEHNEATAAVDESSSKRAVDAAAAPPAIGADSPRFIHWPGDVGRNGFSPAVTRHLIAGFAFDAFLVTESARLVELEQVWNFGDLHLLPVVDEHGSLGNKADITKWRAHLTEHDARLQQRVDKFGSRRMQVHEDLAGSKSLADKLLSRIFVQGGELLASYDGSEQGGISYDILLKPSTAAQTAGELVRQQFLDTVFFDRLHKCPSCASARLNAREECIQCRSADISESTLIHHFRCAHQAPREDFRHGSALICPKCERELRHFGADYDKPGTVISCKACGQSASDIEVGFVCFDCGSHADVGTVKTENVHSYRLTDLGRAYVQEGQIAIGGIQSSLRLNDFSMELLIAVNRLARAYNTTGTPFTLLSVAYPDRKRLQDEVGPRQVMAAREQFRENFSTLLAGDPDLHATETYDYFLLPDVDPNEYRASIDLLASKAAATLRLKFGPRVSVFGPEDLGN